MSGATVTEGDKALRADIARDNFVVDGDGIKIGVIASSFNAKNALDGDISIGELPGEGNPQKNIKPVVVLKDFTSDTSIADDEGRALAQIVHDISPGAELLFHTSINETGAVDDRSYADAVKALVQQGANIIVEDVILPTTVFQDGEAAQSAKDALDKGVILISAAGNNGRISYESEYRSNGETFELGGRTFEALDFDSSDKVDLFQDIKVTRDNTTLFPLLTWSEPNGQVSADFEMFLLSSPTLPIGAGENVLTVSGDPTPKTMDDPIKKLGYSPNKDENLYLVIGRELNGAEAPEMVKWISNSNGSDRTTQYEYINSNGATGASTIYGPANLKETIAVGSADVNQDFSLGLAKIRNFSSEGSSAVLFDEMGNPQNIFEDRIKPDIIGPDGVSTTVAGLENFRGTSAAAPHVAGIVALMQQAAGGAAVLTSEQIKEILQDTAIPVDSVNQMLEFGFPQVDLAVATAQEFASYQYDIC